MTVAGEVDTGLLPQNFVMDLTHSKNEFNGLGSSMEHVVGPSGVMGVDEKESDAVIPHHNDSIPLPPTSHRLHRSLTRQLQLKSTTHAPHVPPQRHPQRDIWVFLNWNLFFWE